MYRLNAGRARSSRDTAFRRADLVADGLLALALTVFAELDLWVNLEQAVHYGPDLATAVATFVATSVLALRRHSPLLTACVVAVAVAAPELFSQLTIQLWGDFVPLLIATYSVARHADAKTAIAGAVAAAAALLVAELRIPVVGTASNVPFTWVPFICAYVSGRVVRQRYRSHVETSDRARQLESDKEETVRLAVAEERGRIARELHDIVAHCVSVMVVQAGAAEDLLDRDPERARQPLVSIQETGRQAVGELGRMLGLLRSDQSQPALAPQPGTAQLSELIEQLAAIGLVVHLTIEGTRRPLSPGVELTVFRVVQEALTNTLKHAGPAAARVVLRYRETSLEVEIVDDGRAGASADASVGTGHGLIGMRERVAIYGGTLAASRMSAGFVVLACLPVDPVSA